MPSTYSNLKIQLMATGENTTTWGDITNVNLGTALEEAIAGSADVTFASNNQTLTLTDTNATQTARNMRLRCTGTTGGSTRDLVVPTIEKPYIVQNDCADSVVVKTSAGTGITVPAGKTMWVYADGTDVVDATTHLTSLTLGTALAVAQGGTGVTTSTGTGSVALSTSPTFVTPILGAATATSIANGLGAVGTPSYTFTGDLNTGMWSPTADTVAVSTDGSERLRIDSSGDVGIGTNNPLFPLHVNGEVRGTKFTSDAASQSLANATDLAILTLTGNPGPQVYQVSIGVNASGGTDMTVALVTVGTDGSGGRDAAVTQLVNGTNTDVTVANVAGTSTVNVQQTTGTTQTISWSITRLM
jgi:hypothetical protein